MSDPDEEFPITRRCFEALQDGCNDGEALIAKLAELARRWHFASSLEECQTDHGQELADAIGVEL